MPKTNSKSFKIFKSVLIILCVIIILTVITIGLVILWSQKLKESTPKRNESMPEEKDVDSILSFIKNLFSIFLSKDFVFELNTK
jgi:flagellar basal body-associated protein FliL